MPSNANSEHRAMGWAAIGGALMGLGALAGISLGLWGAGSHLWSDDYFVAGFAAALLLTLLGFYVLIAEFIGDVGPITLPLPPTRLERAQRRKPVERVKPTSPGNLPTKADRQPEQRLVALYREGEQLRARVLLSGASILNDLVYGRASERQVEREQWARDWDGRVLDILADDARRKWTAAGTLPAGKLDYVTTIAGVRAFLGKKLECLREIITAADHPAAKGEELPPMPTPAQGEQDQQRTRQLPIDQAIRTGENYARLILQAELQNSSKTLTTEMRRTFYNLFTAIESWGSASGSTDQAPQYSGDAGADLERLNVFVAKELARLHVEQEQ